MKSLSRVSALITCKRSRASLSHPERLHKGTSILSMNQIRCALTGENRKFSSKAVFAFVFYLLLPVFALTTIMATYPELSSERLVAIFYRIVPIAFMLILVSQFQVRYTKGSFGRFAMNEIYVLLVLLWLFALLGGEPVIHQTWEEYSFSLHIWNYLLLIIFITAMNVLYYIVEFGAYHDKQVEKSEPQGEAQKEEDSCPVPEGVLIITTNIQ